MIVFLINIVTVLVVVYGLVWAYLLTGYFRQQREAVRNFQNAWQNNTYSVNRKDLDMSGPCLRIEYPVGSERQYVDVGQDGKLLSKIMWSSGSQHNTKPSVYTLRRIEEYTQQIATMWKLEYDDYVLTGE